jgi:pimeloyl-ACP methyl ester carboxylesterase
MFGDRRNMPADSGPGYLAPMALPGLFDHGLSIVSSWTADLRKLEAVLAEAGRIPTLFMWGSKDSAVFLSSHNRLAQYFPNSRLVVFPGVGHLPYEECPDDFNRVLIEFLTDKTGISSGNASGLTVGPRV